MFKFVYGYLDEEFERVKRAVAEALRKRGLSFDRVEVREGGRLNLRIDVFGLSGMWGVSMDGLIEVAKRVEETGLGSVYRIAGKPFPLDFEVTGDEKGLRLTLWF
ncbi:hypothetical protein J7L00_06230 [Candidatus Bathyarchaeota archaeon]|nr:hypothetical protein [Candidatus Bathyarchaeota archaeon]